MMRVVAVITVRNGIDYVEKCLSHLINNKIEIAIIDESSTDGTYEVCESFLGSGLCKLQRVAYPGFFSLEQQLKEKEKFINDLKTDWVIHHDIDECLDSPHKNSLTLYDSIKKEDKAGYSVINFNEFVFLPYEEDISFYDSPYYYFFEPFRPRLMRAWKKKENLSGLASGGHLLQGEISLSPTDHILRHYIFTNQQHAYDKYSNRKFSTEEIKNGWHRNRVDIEPSKLTFPSKHKLEKTSHNKSGYLATSNPWKKHYWE